MKIAVHFPIWRREPIARIAASCLKRIEMELAEEGVETAVLVIGNEDHAVDIAKIHGWNFLKYKNSPLGEKFNRGARWLVDRHPDADYFMEFGQDNILRDDFAQMILDVLRSDSRIWSITSSSFYMIHEKTGEVRLFNRGAGSNIGRLTRMDLIRRIRNIGPGHIYDEHLKIGLDRSLREKLQAVTGRLVRLRDIASPYIIDVKGSDNLNAWSAFASRPDRFPETEIVGNFPELTQLSTLWQPPEKSDPTRSTSTSQPSPGTPSTRTPSQRTTPTKSSPVQPPEPSPANSKRSTPPRKTTTARGRSSSRPSPGR